jgi:hypothetical protein
MESRAAVERLRAHGLNALILGETRLASASAQCLNSIPQPSAVQAIGPGDPSRRIPFHFGPGAMCRDCHTLQQNDARPSIRLSEAILAQQRNTVETELGHAGVIVALIVQGRSMFEFVIAVGAFASATIFVAHLVDGYRAAR